MEAVNYSSARVGLAEERDIWRGLQLFVVNHFCREIFGDWSQAAWLEGLLPNVTARQFQEIQNPLFRARGWSYVDPEKEVAATSDALENKLTTWTDALAERGMDLVEHLETLSYEQKLAAKYGVELKISSKQPQKPTDDQPKE